VELHLNPHHEEACHFTTTATIVIPNCSDQMAFSINFHGTLQKREKMQLTVRNVAKFLNVSEQALYRMIERGEIPSTKVHDQFHFNRTELLEWAMARRIHVSPNLLDEEETDGATADPRLSAALRQGGIFYGLPSGDKSIALRAMVSVLRLPADVDKELLFRMHLARETLASTGVGDGIAIPHVRNPVVLQVTVPMVTLCFLKTPVDFGAVDEKPVFALFSLVTPTIRSHLFLLSRLALTLRNHGLLELLRSRASEDLIMAEIERSETSSASDPGTNRQEGDR